MLDLFFQNQYLKIVFIFVSYILGAFFISVIVKYVLKNFVSKLTKKTKSNFDDFILKTIMRPTYVFLFLLGFYFGFRHVFPEYILWANNVLFVVSVLFITYTISQILVKVITDWMKVKKGYEKTPRLINGIITIILYSVAVLMILNYFNVSITPLIATLGIGGLAIGLALQSTLANLFAGIHLISDRPINVGDFVEIGEVRGFVQDIGWRSTKIRTYGNNIYIMSNSKLADSTIHNMSLNDPESSLVVNCGVGYGMNLEKVEKITLKVAKKIQDKSEGTIKDYNPIMRYTDFGDSNINFFVILRLQDYTDLSSVRHAFIKELKKEYDKNKIDISWPVRKVVMSK